MEYSGILDEFKKTHKIRRESQLLRPLSEIFNISEHEQLLLLGIKPLSLSDNVTTVFWLIVGAAVLCLLAFALEISKNKVNKLCVHNVILKAMLLNYKILNLIQSYEDCCPRNCKRMR